MPPFPFIKVKNDTKLEEYYVKNKLLRYPMSENSDLYKFKVSFFDNQKLEEFILFIQNLKMTNNPSGRLTANSKLQYLRTVLCGKALHQFDTLCDQVGSTTMEHLN